MKNTLKKLNENKLYILVFCALVLLFVIYEPIVLIHGGNGHCMEPTITADTYAVGVSFDKQFKHGDIISFDAQAWGADDQYMKRVVAVPGDVVVLNNKEIYVNGVKQENTWPTNYAAINKTYKLADGEYFVLGDNGKVSDDSRFHGPVSIQYISFKVIFWF